MTPDRPSRRPRICFVVSAPETAIAFLNPHIERLANDYEIDVVMNAPEGDPRVSAHCHQHNVPIARRVTPIEDVRALWQLRKQLRRGKYTAVHSVTPKAGLLTSVATLGLGIPIRIHWFTGQVWANRLGARRFALRSLDRVVAFRTTTALVDSASQRTFLIAEGVVNPASTLVLGAGSICGVDTERFRPDSAARTQVRRELGIPDESPIVVFVGRLNRDKGVLTLAAAFGQLDNGLDAHLMLIGTDEEGLSGEVLALAGQGAARTRIVGHVANSERYLAASDIFCLPSYREGFGMAAIEAAAVALPSVVTDIYGLTDAVVAGETGALVPPGDTVKLSETLTEMLRDPSLRRDMGLRARSRAQSEFNQEVVTGALGNLYRDLIAKLNRG